MKEFLAIVKALGDSSRVRALMTVKDGELCLCEIVDVLGLAPATVSRHMNILHRAGLVRRRRDGKWQYYRMAGEDAPPPVRRALAWAVAELDRDPRVREDVRRVRRARRKARGELLACYRG